MSETSEEVAAKLGVHSGKRRVPRWILYSVALIFGIGSVGYWFSTADPDRDVRYVTDQAIVSDLRITVTATGTIEPTNLVEISSELSGTLGKVYVDFNDTVEKGDVLAELDTAKLEAQLAVSKARLDSSIARIGMAEATLDEAKEKYESALRLEERGVTAHHVFITHRAVYARAQAELQAARADRALAEAQVDLDQTDLEKACICSPIAGVVLDRAVDEGQIVAAVLSAPVLFTIAEDLTKMELQVDIDEADIGQTAVGNSALFTVDAYDDRTFPAEIAEIRFAPKTVDGVVTYKAVLSIDNSDLLLRPGMTATADITVAEISDALTVPNAALRYAPPIAPQDDDERSGLLGMLIPERLEPSARGDRNTLWVMRAGVPTQITIRAGASDGRVTEILEGDLAAGDLVVLERKDG